MANVMEKGLLQAIAERRATPSFTGEAIPREDLQRIVLAGLNAPSGYNLQPWRFVVVHTPEQRTRLRAASFNQAKVEEASAVIVACGDLDGWRNGDVEEMLRMGLANGMQENYADMAKKNIPQYLGSHPNLEAWLNRHVMIALTTMMWMAEVMGYDTAPMEGFEPDKVAELLKLPQSYRVVALLGVGRRKGADKYFGGRFSPSRLVFDDEYGKPLAFE
jgi:nitroreductase